MAGKNLPDTDTARSFVVNEKLATMVGYDNPADIIGKRIKMWEQEPAGRGRVVQNFHATMSPALSLWKPPSCLNRVRVIFYYR